MFAALQGANVDWNVVAGAIATFIVTAIATGFGFRRGFIKVKENAKPTPIVGASLMDNMSIMMLHESLKENTDINRQLHNDLVQICTLLQVSLNNRH